MDLERRVGIEDGEVLEAVRVSGEVAQELRKEGGVGNLQGGDERNDKGEGREGGGRNIVVEGEGGLALEGSEEREGEGDGRSGQEVGEQKWRHGWDEMSKGGQKGEGADG